jgi:hypothetical protein
MSNSNQLDPDGGLSLDQLIRQIDNRLAALRPLVREFEQLEAARAALVADYGAATAGGASRRARPASALPSHRRRAPRGANRAAILSLAGERPGITVAEIAQTTGIGKPTVHSTVYALTRRGELARAGDGVKLAGSSEPAPGAARRAPPERRPATRRRPARKAGRARAVARKAAARRRASARRTPEPSAPAKTAPSPAADDVPDAP